MLLVAGAALSAVTVSVRAAAPESTRIVTLVGGVTVFDRTVAAPLETDAGLNVLMAAQGAAREAGASDLDIIEGTTISASSVEIDVDDIQDGSDMFGVTQTGSAQAGDAIGGQVVSVVGPEGSVSVSATNNSHDVHTVRGSSGGANNQS